MENFKGLFDSQTLDAFGITHGTDKSSKQHDYLRKYQFFLEPWKNDTFTCLELGIYKGYSLKMWKDFFPNAKIVGADNKHPFPKNTDGFECKNGHSLKKWKEIFPNTKIPSADSKHSAPKNTGDFEYKIGDLGDIEFLTSLQSYKPRLIIDDASHIWNHQLNAFFTLFPHVQPGGIYILEDICTSFEPWAKQHKSYESVTPFHVMETLAECLTSQEKNQSGEQVLPLSPPGPYQSLIEMIAKTVDCVAFIKFSCLIIKKKCPSSL